MSELWSACRATKTLSAMLGVNHLGESGKIIFSALEEALAQGRDLGASEVLRREKRIAALESRLAEVAPVVEAAELAVAAFGKQRHAFLFEYERKLIVSVTDMRAARSLRGAGEGEGG